MGTRSEDLVFEHKWVEEFAALSKKAGQGNIHVRMSSPACYLNAIGFLPQVDEEKIVILLQRESPSGLADGVLQFFLPEEDTAQYLKRETDEGEIALSIRYPYCPLHPLQYARWADFHIATSAEALIVAGTDTPVQ